MLLRDIIRLPIPWCMYLDVYTLFHQIQQPVIDSVRKVLILSFVWRVRTAFCKIFSGTPHLTIFGTLNYVPKYGQIHQIRYLGSVFGRSECTASAVFLYKSQSSSPVPYQHCWLFLTFCPSSSRWREKRRWGKPRWKRAWTWSRGSLKHIFSLM